MQRAEDDRIEGCRVCPADLVAGRLSTGDPVAIDAYVRAVQHACDHGSVSDALLAQVLAADPTCAAALADRGEPLPDGRGCEAGSVRTRWERQHVEIVTTANRDEIDRAEALLRDHTADFGCDPLALLAVISRTDAAHRLDDLRDARCRCPWGGRTAERGR